MTPQSGAGAASLTCGNDINMCTIKLAPLPGRTDLDEVWQLGLQAARVLHGLVEPARGGPLTQGGRVCWQLPATTLRSACSPTRTSSMHTARATTALAFSRPHTTHGATTSCSCTDRNQEMQNRSGTYVSLSGHTPQSPPWLLTIHAAAVTKPTGSTLHSPPGAHLGPVPHGHDAGVGRVQQVQHHAEHGRPA